MLDLREISQDEMIVVDGGVQLDQDGSKATPKGEIMGKGQVKEVKKDGTLVVY